MPVCATREQSHTVSVSPPLPPYTDAHVIADGEPATIQVQVIPPPPVFLPEPPLCKLAIVAGHATVGEPARHGSDSSSSDTVTSDGFVAIKPIPPPRSITEVTATGQAGTPQIAPIFETPPKNCLPRLAALLKSKPAVGVSDPPGIDHVALDMGGDTDRGDIDPIYAALLKDQRHSIQMRSQAYASIAVVAALIAGISVTFLVEIDVMPKDADGTFDERSLQSILLNSCAVGTLLVCFMSLYGTMVLAMQYYLITRALGHVSTVSRRDEEATLNEISQFMANTRWVRHFAVKCVIISVPLFSVVIAAFGVAKNGMGTIAYGSIVCGVIASFFFAHAIISQNAAFGQQVAAVDDDEFGKDSAPPVLHKRSSTVLFATEKYKLARKPSDAMLSAGPKPAMRMTAERLLKQTRNQASNFRLVW